MSGLATRLRTPYADGRPRILAAIDPDTTGDMHSPRNPLKGGFQRALEANDDALRSAAEAYLGGKGIRAYCELVDFITAVEDVP